MVVSIEIQIDTSTELQVHPKVRCLY